MNKDCLVKLREQLDAALESGTPEAYHLLASALALALGQVKPATSSPPESGDDLGRALQAIEGVLFQASPPPARLPGRPEQRDRLARLLADLLAIQQFTLLLSTGDLAQTLKTKGLMAGGLKALQANLRHLTWQTQMIARGDFSQRVDFMGDFSASFNSMVDSLNEAQRQLQHREAELIQANARLKEANEDLEAFSYSVSHDLRAPLRAISGFSRMLANEHAGRLEAEGCRLLGVISGSAQIMGQLINDLLAFSRSGRQRLQKSLINMTDLARNVFVELQDYDPERHIRFVLPDLPPAYGDRSLCRQVWTNLLANALKFTGPVLNPVIEVGGRCEDDEEVYFVKDNGVGFDLSQADRLFGVFQRLHRDSEFEGTGVGLAIVQRIIQRHGGRVWAEGRDNEGATFYFTIPRN